MQKIGSKLLAFIVVASMLISYTTPVVYAQGKANIETSEANVELNATIENDTRAVVSTTQQPKLNLKLKVSNTGYTKDIKVKLNNNNFKLLNVDNTKINKIEGDTILLNEVKAGEEVNVAIPVEFNRQELYSADYFNKTTKLDYDLIYVNKQGKEKNVKKTFDLNLNWNDKQTPYLKQSIYRFTTVKDKTIITLKLENGIVENRVPIAEKNIKLTVPLYNNMKPEKISVIADGASYKVDNNVLNINFKNNVEDKKMLANTNGTYYVSYVYPSKMVKFNLPSQAELEIVDANKNTLKTRADNENFKLETRIGNVIDLSINSLGNISKGYMYANTVSGAKQDTYFNLIYNFNIGMKEFTDSIILDEGNNLFDKYNANPYIITKVIKVNPLTMKNIFGDSGYIRVYDKATRTVVGEITSKNPTIYTNSKQVMFETSKPLNEGQIEIGTLKAISSEMKVDESFIKGLNKAIFNVQLQNMMNGKDGFINRISENKVIDFEEPKSNASLEINKTNLSTITENKNFVINAGLRTREISDRLYKDPIIKITLPEEVEKVEFVKANLLDESELKVEEAHANKNEVYIKLQGQQKTYSNSNVSSGAVIRLVTNLKVNHLTPTKESKITFTYYNDADKTTNKVESKVNIIAPTGVVTVQELDYDGKNAEAIYNDSLIKVDPYEVSKKMTVKGKVLNNLTSDMEGFKLVAQIPTKSTTALDGTKKNSTFDATLASELKVSGIEGQVLYSDDVNADPNGNKWGARTANSKVMLFVSNAKLNKGQTIDYEYNVVTPENLDYDNTGLVVTNVLYNNKSREGVKQNTITGKSVGITTGKKPNIYTDVKFTDYNTGKVLTNDKEIKDGQILNCEIKIKNDTDVELKNTKATVNLPKSLYVMGNEKYEMTGYSTLKKNEKKDVEYLIPQIKPGEEKKLNFIVAPDKKTKKEENLLIKLSNDQLKKDLQFKRDILIKDSDYTVLASSNKLGRDIYDGDDLIYDLKIQSLNDKKPLKNVELTAYLPATFKLGAEKIQVLGAKGKVEFKDNTLRINIPEVKRTVSVRILGNVETNKDITQKAIFKYKFAGISETELPALENLVRKSPIKYSLSSITNNNINDNEVIEINGQLENIGDEAKLVSILDEIKEGATVEEFTVVTSKGTETTNDSLSVINKSILLDPYSKASFKLRLRPDKVKIGTVNPYTNTLALKLFNEEIEKKDFTFNIVGTSTSINVINQPEPTILKRVVKDDKKITAKSKAIGTAMVGAGAVNTSLSEPGRYNIAGTAWLDLNKNGIREQSEEKISGITIALYDIQTNDLAKTSNGTDIITSTLSNGTYVLNNIKPGKYKVVADYDREKYKLTSDGKGEVLENQNNDFYDRKLEGVDFAMTEIIEVKDANIYNIDLGLTDVNNFDFGLEKIVNKITVTNQKDKTRNYEYNKPMAKVELSTKYIEFATVLVEYSIKVHNYGKVAGTVKSVVDYLPKDMEFSSELNPTWYLGEDGNAYTTSLANVEIQPGESKELKLVLKKRMNGENTGMVRNTAELMIVDNNYGYEDANSTPGNKNDGENDMSSADVLILANTGKETISLFGISLGILTLISIAVYAVKRNIIDKTKKIL